MEEYEPIKVLGEGSFGKVYLMKHSKTRDLVCTKVSPCDVRGGSILGPLNKYCKSTTREQTTPGSSIHCTQRGCNGGSFFGV